MFSKQSAALFDFDGVIVDSTPLHLEGWKIAYQQIFGLSLEQNTVRALIGKSTRGIARILAEKSGFRSAREELVRIKSNYVIENIGRISLIEGTCELLETLKLHAIPFGIVSNAPRDFVDRCLKAHHVDVPFFLGLEDYQRPKPDAEPYMKGSRKLGSFNFAMHKHIFVFEDSTHGLEAAVSAKMTPIGICSQHDADTLYKAGAVLCFDNLTDVDAWVRTGLNVAPI